MNTYYAFQDNQLGFGIVLHLTLLFLEFEKKIDNNIPQNVNKPLVYTIRLI